MGEFGNEVVGGFSHYAVVPARNSASTSRLNGLVVAAVNRIKRFSTAKHQSGISMVQPMARVLPVSRGLPLNAAITTVSA